jgi:hypothetical protein
MEAQKPAEGILQLKNHPTWKWYKIPCECGCDSEVEISIEIDEPDDHFITCHVASKVKTAYWRETFTVTYTEMWLVQAMKITANDVIRRLQICWTALTKGYIEMESYTLLTTQQALNLSTVIKTTIDELEVANLEEFAKRSAEIAAKKK